MTEYDTVQQKQVIYEFFRNQRNTNGTVLGLYIEKNRPTLPDILNTWVNQDLSLLQTIEAEYKQFVTQYYQSIRPLNQ